MRPPDHIIYSDFWAPKRSYLFWFLWFDVSCRTRVRTIAAWSHGPTFREGHQRFMIAVHLLPSFLPKTIVYKDLPTSSCSVKENIVSDVCSLLDEYRQKQLCFVCIYVTIINPNQVYILISFYCHTYSLFDNSYIPSQHMGTPY
jgi:hypothetical protein